MVKRMLIDATHAEESRVVVINGTRLEEFDVETSTKKQLKGNIYLAKVTRVEPSLQAAFVDYGGNRHGFLAFSEIHSDYYQIPVADRAALEAEQTVAPRPAEGEDGDGPAKEAKDGKDTARPRRSRSRRKKRETPAPSANGDAAGETGAAATTAEATAETAVAAGETATEAPSEPPVEATPDAEVEVVEAEPVAPEDIPRGEATMAADAPELVIDAVEVEAKSDKTGERIEDLGGDDTEDYVEASRPPLQKRYKIQEVVKRRQILLVQVVKEERGNKGAALSTFLSLAGRYCVLMPNTPRGGGISRKISSAKDRKRLKTILADLEIPEGMAVIVRTAGAERTKAEIKRDFDYLLRLWDRIRETTLKSQAPCLIYEEANLIKRSIRDLYARDIDEVLVEGDDGYRVAKDFMKMLMPSHAKRVQPYRDATVPLFHRYQVESQLDAMHNPVVQLKSGGYIVINPTEALVAIDVNSGRATKERNIEETALRTNQEAAEEIARQLRLRDLAGLIVIDFIDMEENRNQFAVERRLKEAMRNDRARLQIGRISPFGLLELSRQRLRPSIMENSFDVCHHCRGTGLVRSVESSALHILRVIEEEGMRRRSAALTVHVATPVALYILNRKRDSLAEIEARYGFSVVIEGDDSLVTPDHRIERLKSLKGPESGEEAVLNAESVTLADEEDDRQEEDRDGSKRKRRRRRRRGRGDDEAPSVEASPIEDEADEPAEESEENGEDDDTPRKRRRRGKRGGRRRTRRGDNADGELNAARDDVAPAADAATEARRARPHAPESEDTEPEIDIRPARQRAAQAPEAAAANSTPAAREETGDGDADGRKGRSRRRERPPRRRRERKRDLTADTPADAVTATEAPAETTATPAETPATADTAPPAEIPAAAETASPAEIPAAAETASPAETPAAAETAPPAETSAAADAIAEPAGDQVAPPAPEAVVDAPPPAPEPAPAAEAPATAAHEAPTAPAVEPPAKPKRPRRSGWWAGGV